MLGISGAFSTAKPPLLDVRLVQPADAADAPEHLLAELEAVFDPPRPPGVTCPMPMHRSCDNYPDTGGGRPAGYASARQPWWPVFRCPLVAGFGCPPRAGDLAGPADVLEPVGQCSHADAGGDTLLAGVHGISVVERLKTRHLQLTVRGVTWTPFLLPRLSGDLPLSTLQATASAPRSLHRCRQRLTSATQG
jgi:hypothetical protein